MPRISTGGAEFLGSFAMIYAVVASVAMLVVHVTFALAVFADRPPRRVLVSQGIWALATLIGGAVVGALYWIAHRWPRKEETGAEG